MKELWKERKELLPKFHSSYLNSITEEKKKEEEEKERKYIDLKIKKTTVLCYPHNYLGCL